MSFATKLIHFYTTLPQLKKLPEGVQALYPYSDPLVTKLVKRFFNTFYNDANPRRLMLGINPGRMGAGVTGINFTGPRQMKINCGIDHPFGEQSELSAEFIYEMIESYGGPAKFYGDHFIGATSSIGFTKDGLNMNYYDDKNLVKSVEPFILDSIRQLTGMGFKRDKCFSIGGDKNFRFLSKLNEEHHFFDEIVPLPHPRFIMQYRRKQKEDYIRQYVETLK